MSSATRSLTPSLRTTGLLAGLLLVAPATAAAGDLVLHSEVAAQIDLGTTPLVHTWGPAKLRVTGLSPGVADLRIARGDRTDVLEVVVPDSGAALVEIGSDRLGTEPYEPPAPTLDAEGEAPAPDPVLELRAAVGQRFAVVLDGARLAVIGDAYPVRVEGVKAGQHDLEFRTTDLTVVWMRGQLELQDDDLVIVTGQEGYAPLVSGRPAAFRLLGSAPKKEPTQGGSASEPQGN